MFADIDDVEMSVELVEHCLKELGRNKSDGTNLYSNHFVLPRSLRNIWQNCSQLSSDTGTCLLLWETACLSVLKPLKDPSNSYSYRPNWAIIFLILLSCISSSKDTTKSSYFVGEGIDLYTNTSCLNSFTCFDCCWNKLGVGTIHCSLHNDISRYIGRCMSCMIIVRILIRMWYPIISSSRLTAL